jgi:short-subunit dehydrogenase
MVAEGAGRMALVTGASAGIGEAFARVLAERGYDLVLTARRQERLEGLAAALQRTNGIRTLIVVEDLADARAPERLMAAITAAGWHVDLLVNNAGYGVPGSYVATRWEAQRDFLQVLVVAVAHLSHLALPGMIERQWGRIINVASLAGLMPGVAGHTLYAAAKAFVITFSESLALEVSPHHVHVTASCPGFTLSEFHDVTGTRDRVSRMPSYMWMDAAVVARDSYAAVMAGRPVFTPGRVNRSLALLGRLLPRGVVRGAMARSAGRFRQT